jgi:hypothetical protein
MRLADYEDLVFSPLAMPPPPDVDTARLIEWMTWARAEGHKRGLNVPERGYEAATGRPYPWLMANVFYPRPSHVEESFEREFPDLLRYAHSFPLKDLKLVVLLAQRGDIDVHLHTDSDGHWGFRFYLANKRQDALYFHMARERAGALPPSASDWATLVELDTRHYARWPEGNRPYCLNSIRAAHAVEANTCRLGERIACLVIPRDGPDETRLLRLLEESSAAVGSYQIWYGQGARTRLC